MILTPPRTPLFPYTTLFRSVHSFTDTVDVEPLGGPMPGVFIRAPRIASIGSGVEIIARRQGERSEEHTSELQSRFDLVCRLLLEKKKKNEFMAIGCERGVVF